MFQVRCSSMMVLLLLAFFASSYFFFSVPSVVERGAVQKTAIPAARAIPLVEMPLHAATPQTKDFFDRAYATAEPGKTFDILPRGIILPHHLVAAAPIARAMEALAAHPPKRVVIIGPDHLSRARRHAIVSEAVWETPYGFVLPDSGAIARLTEVGAAAVDESVFGIEHSIPVLLPFVKRSFPNATVVPLLVRDGLRPDEMERLVAALPDDPETLVIASVDFSHYQPGRVAAFHDVQSRAVLQSGEGGLLREIEADSPETLALLGSLMRQRGAQTFRLLSNTNSSIILGDASLAETTSYLIGAFVPGLPNPDQTVTVLATGDLMFDRAVRGYMQTHGTDYPFALLRGAEDRFFRGVDIVTGNLEGAIAPHRAPEKENDFAFDASVADLLRRMHFSVVNQANNHALDQNRLGATETRRALAAVGVGSAGDQVVDDLPPWTTTVRGRSVAMLGYNMTDNPVDEQQGETAVRTAAKENDIVLVQVHWGAEYAPRPTDEQRAFGRTLVEWGATAVIGTHPHVIQGMEIWKGRPIFWSLGNTVFDQDWSKETQQGILVGLAMRPDGVGISLFPIQIEKGQPRLIPGKEDERILGIFADRSDLPDALRAAARTGIVEILFE